ncbi:MAG: extracellular solute-binding protein [Chloroflexi bacterium]|nr:extracellular solute-binding protein [Chloroflexota bacterium]
MRRLVTSLVVSLMVGMLLVACGDSTATTAPAPTTAAATTAAATATTAAAATTAAGTATTAAATTAAGTATTAATTTSAATTAAVKQNITLTLIASQGWIKDPEQALGKKFEEQTGIHIDYQIIPADQYFNVLKTRLNSGQGPDIFGGQTGAGQLASDYNVEKNAVDLSNEPWVKTEDPISVNETTVNGKVYGLTVWDTKGGTFVVNYNKQIFQQLGLSVPKTYAEFKAICDKILAAGITPIYEPIADGWHHVLWFPHQGPRWEENTPGLKDLLNTNKTTFADNKDALTTLQQMQEMYTNGYFGGNALSDTGDQTEAKLSSGKFAMNLNTLNEPAAIVKAYPDQKLENWGYFPMPLDDNQIVAVNPGGPSKFIYSGSKHIDAAKQYLAFLTQPDNLQYLLDNEPTFSALNFQGVKDKFNTEQKNFFTTYPKTGTVYQASITYVNAQWFDMGKDMVAMFSGGMQPLDVLKKIDQRRATAAKTANDPAWK